jgi:hypothetical protein
MDYRTRPTISVVTGIAAPYDKSSQYNQRMIAIYKLIGTHSKADSMHCHTIRVVRQYNTININININWRECNFGWNGRLLAPNYCRHVPHRLIAIIIY